MLLTATLTAICHITCLFLSGTRPSHNHLSACAMASHLRSCYAQNCLPGLKVRVTAGYFCRTCLLGTHNDTMLVLQREAERRLASAKQSVPAARPGQKRGRAAESDNEAISDEEEPALQVRLLCYSQQPFPTPSMCQKHFSLICETSIWQWVRRRLLCMPRWLR